MVRFLITLLATKHELSNGMWMWTSTLVGLGLGFRVVGAGVGVPRFGVVEVQMQGFC